MSKFNKLLTILFVCLYVFVFVFVFFFVWFKCEDPLGMESKIITDAQISVSSSFPQTPWFSHSWSFHVWFWEPSNVRLNNFGWRANRDDQNQWIKVDLRRYTKVTRVATQGGRSRNYGVSGWVTNFKILYSLDGVLWQMYKEHGNSNASVKVRSRTC